MRNVALTIGVAFVGMIQSLLGFIAPLSVVNAWLDWTWFVGFLLLWVYTVILAVRKYRSKALWLVLSCPVLWEWVLWGGQ